ncbi:MAG: nucleotide pyrophosphohydrolase [Candidatus Magasanikbacteria bacterium]
MTTDNETTIQSLKNLVKEFRDNREWAQFHDPKNVAEAISIEAAELQEHFLWKDKEQIANLLNNDEEFRTEVSEELADVVCYCLNFANSTGIDVTQAVMDKLEKNDAKYPVDKSKGLATKYNKL